MVVRFIESRSTSTLRLTNNRDYEVLRQANNRYYITNDRHSVQPYDVRLFDVIEGDNEPVMVEQIQEQPAPARRRGRPTNAELEARRAATQPVETDAQRRAREAREEQERLEAARIAEEQRRGRIRTEQDKADSITVDISNEGHTVKVSIAYDNRERLNDSTDILRRNAAFTVEYTVGFSCGVNRFEGVQSFLTRIHNFLNYQEDDYEILRTELFRKTGIALQALLDRQDGNIIRNAAFDMCSVITTNTDAVNYADILIEYFGFTEAAPSRRNPNSNNDIVVLIRRRA